MAPAPLAPVSDSDIEAVWDSQTMAWATPQFSRQMVDEAGNILVQSRTVPIDALDEALEIVNNWRSSHSFPLNTFQVYLRRSSRLIDPQSLVAQRIKRLSSITLKLRRFEWLKLSEMQDIGGCRAVVRSVRHVDELVALYKNSQIKHYPADEDDYIRQPKKSGYRGYHLIYRYNSDRKETYNNLKIEMQFRSQLQHAWATAVETVGTFIRQALKSSQGEAEWLRFFALMSSALAIREKTALIPATPINRRELVAELRECNRSLDVERRLQAYGATLQTLEQPGSRNAHYFLLALDPSQDQVTVTGYEARELEKAARQYLETERMITDRPGAEAVLVSVESLDALRRAYPNYFLDTRAFLAAVRRALSE